MKSVQCAAAGIAHCQHWLLHLIHICIVGMVCPQNYVWCHMSFTGMFCASGMLLTVLKIQNLS